MSRRGAARPLVWIIRRYQSLSSGMPPRCRYLPTCSEYAAEAVETRGPAMGTWLAVRRIGRCHPWGGHGYDPVPPCPTRTVPLALHRRNAHGA